VEGDAYVLTELLDSCKEKLKATQQTMRRLHRNVKSLADVINVLQEKNSV